jgi:hypothetical protein
MSEKPIVQQAADKAGVTVEAAMTVLETFLEWIHKAEFESGDDSDTVVPVSFELSDRAFFHFIGFIEQFSICGWEPGFIVEYLGRMPPTERWETLSEEMKDWKRSVP